MSQSSMDVQLVCSVIVPVYNCALYLEQCLTSILEQKDVLLRSIEVILFDDCSTDDSLQIAQRLSPRMITSLYRYIVLTSKEAGPSGCGSARNRCCEVAQSDVFVFLDADDVMMPNRISRSLPLLQEFGIVGGNFHRLPHGSTPRYEQYHRSITTEQISSLAYAFRDASLAMPTVACTRRTWESIGGFVEGRGVPEDLHFQYAAIERGISLGKLGGDSLVGYRYHANMASLALSRKMLLRVRVAAFERIILSRPKWRDGFSVWGAGRDGKEFYKSLCDTAKRLVLEWGDIDPNKIGKQLRGKPVVHFSQLRPPIVICVAMARDGDLERNLAETDFVAGQDFFHIS